MTNKLDEGRSSQKEILFMRRYLTVIVLNWLSCFLMVKLIQLQVIPKNKLYIPVEVS